MKRDIKNYNLLASQQARLSCFSLFSQKFISKCPRRRGGGGWGGGGCTALYQLYKYVPPQKVWFLSRFGLKTGIDFDHYGLKSDMVFTKTTRAYKRLCLFNSK